MGVKKCFTCILITYAYGTPKSEHDPCCWNLQECIPQSIYLYWKYQWESIHGGIRMDINRATLILREKRKKPNGWFTVAKLEHRTSKNDDFQQESPFQSLNFQVKPCCCRHDLGWVLQPNTGILGSVTSTSQLRPWRMFMRTSSSPTMLLGPFCPLKLKHLTQFCRRNSFCNISDLFRVHLTQMSFGVQRLRQHFAWEFWPRT